MNFFSNYRICCSLTAVLFLILFISCSYNDEVNVISEVYSDVKFSKGGGYGGFSPPHLDQCTIIEADQNQDSCLGVIGRIYCDFGFPIIYMGHQYSLTGALNACRSDPDQVWGDLVYCANSYYMDEFVECLEQQGWPPELPGIFDLHQWQGEASMFGLTYEYETKHQALNFWYYESSSNYQLSTFVFQSVQHQYFGAIMDPAAPKLSAYYDKTIMMGGVFDWCYYTRDFQGKGESTQIGNLVIEFTHDGSHEHCSVCNEYYTWLPTWDCDDWEGEKTSYLWRDIF